MEPVDNPLPPRATPSSSRVQRFTRSEDLADLEHIPSSHTHAATFSTSTTHHTKPASRAGNSSARAGTLDSSLEQQERARRYIDIHTSFLNSADTEGSGYIPNRATIPSMLVHGHGSSHHVHSDDNISSLSPAPYPSSLAEDEGLIAPGTPNSLLSSPSLGYYSHASRPSSRTGFWVDQTASSLNLVMPSSAMYARGREPTAEGDKLGFIKLMVAGRNRAWHARLIQDMFKWEGVIANDFEDEFLQDPQTQMDAGPSIIHAADAKDASHSADGSGSNRSGGEQDDVWRESRQERYQGVAEVIVEHYASSMVLPAWARAGLDVQEMQQEILVKNICFVDTPGYSSFNNPNRAMDLVVSYLGLQFQTTNEFFARSAVSDDSLGRFLANNATGAHSHVDACLYIIEGQLTDLDVVFMQRLQAWVNLIPVLIPSTAPKDGCDTTMTSLAIDVSAARQDLIRQLQQHDTEIYGMEHVIAAANATDSPFSSDASPEDDLSPPPLSLDGGLMHSDVTSPPFVYMVPLTNLVAGAAGGLDQDVQQLDVTPQDESSYRPASASVSTSQPSLPSSSDVYGRLARADLALLQKWIFVDHLAALRHHTTLKFLRWRRYLPTVSPSSMNSSMDLSSSRYRQPSYNQNSYLPFPHLNGTIPGTLRPFVPTTAGDSPPLSATGPTEVRQYPLPTELASELMARDQKRVSCKAARLLGTHRKVFERIMLERQEAWRRALQGIEREHRIDFLVRELKRWATSDQSIPFEQQVYDTDTRPLERSMEGSDHVVGLGSEVGMAVGSAPSLRDALSLSSSVSLEPTESGRRGSGGRCVLRPSRRKSGRVAHSVPLRPTSTGANEPIDDEVDSEDPLGLGLWMSEIFGAIGNGIVHVVALVGMGSLATWIYTHYLEHQVTWIG